ncbi:TetR/AcrR family transcriptional regulator [Zavarzinia sp.]|uniref:TetR/AcrR family transcriptional regulator n=1 Tax=Zavarzinia sp. TaxID=2027920 RepID=UPI0035625BD5
MSLAHRRPKQPDLVRRQLLDVAAELALEVGVGGLRLDAVARRAGVSKGGLLHHFPSRQALLEALCGAYLAEIGARIGAEMAADPVAPGRFSRAYLTVMTGGAASERERAWGLLSVVLFAEPGFRDRWGDWLAARLAEHRATDAAPLLDVVRFAADGVWLADMCGEAVDPAARAATVALLREMTCKGKEALP